MNVENTMTAPVPEYMRERVANYMRDQAEFDASPMRQAAAGIGSCAVCVGGVGLCIVSPVLGCVSSDSVTCIVLSISSGICCLGTGSILYGNEPSYPTDEPVNRDG